MMSEEIIDNETTMNIAASARNHSELTKLKSDFWGTDESSDHSMKPVNKDASQKYLVQTGKVSFIYEEQILDSVFRACDEEDRGMVPAFQIIDYLKRVTDPSRDENRLQCLSNLLDPEGQNTLVDLLTFHKAMSRWIESCWKDRAENRPTEEEMFIKDLQSSEIQGTSLLNEYGGYCNRNTGEHTDLSIKMAELNCTNKKLTDQKTKLQRSLDLAEETNTLLAEEISDLKGKLKSSQQAMQHARSMCNELEDKKMFVTNLEDKMSVVIAQKKQLEKEILLLSNQKMKLQEENDKLLAEKEKAKEKLESLRVENSKLLHQLDKYENVIVQKDELLTQKIIQTEELTGLVEEQKTLLQELKNEKNNLQEELLQTHEDIAIHSSLSHKQHSSFLSVRSVHNEIEEIQESNSNRKLQLPDPEHQTAPCSGEVEKIEVEKIEEEKIEVEKIEVEKIEVEKIEVEKIEVEKIEVEKIEEDIWTATETELEESTILLKGLSCLTHLKCAWETYVSKINGAKKINAKNNLSLLQNTRLFPEEGCLLAPLVRKLSSSFSTRKLLLMISLYILMIFTWSGENICTVVSRTLWPHLKLLHLKPPPI